MRFRQAWCDVLLFNAGSADFHIPGALGELMHLIITYTPSLMTGSAWRSVTHTLHALKGLRGYVQREEKCEVLFLVFVNFH